MLFNNDKLKYLPTRGAEGEEDAVKDEGGELGHEDEGGVECPLLQQRRRRQDDGEEVDAAHHLHRAHLVHREQLVLPRRREGVERHVAWKERGSVEVILLYCGFWIGLRLLNRDLLEEMYVVE